MKASGVCTVTEIDPATGTRKIVLVRHNVFTVFGLAALAQAISGNYLAPVFLTMQSDKGTLTAAYAAGVGSISTNASITLAGDTQIILGIGTVNQETVTFSAVAGSGPCTYTLTGVTAKSHALGDVCFRTMSTNDTVASVLTPIQFDTVGSPGLWPGATSGYQAAQTWTQQWYFTSAQAVTYITAIGMCDSATIGSGNLHDHLILGYDHSAGTQDVEIDIALTLTN